MKREAGEELLPFSIPLKVYNGTTWQKCNEKSTYPEIRTVSSRWQEEDHNIRSQNWLNLIEYFAQKWDFYKVSEGNKKILLGQLLKLPIDDDVHLFLSVGLPYQATIPIDITKIKKGVLFSGMFIIVVVDTELETPYPIEQILRGSSSHSLMSYKCPWITAEAKPTIPLLDALAQCNSVDILVLIGPICIEPENAIGNHLRIPGSDNSSQLSIFSLYTSCLTLIIGAAKKNPRCRILLVPHVNDVLLPTSIPITAQAYRDTFTVAAYMNDKEIADLPLNISFLNNPGYVSLGQLKLVFNGWNAAVALEAHAFNNICTPRDKVDLIESAALQGSLACIYPTKPALVDIARVDRAPDEFVENTHKIHMEEDCESNSRVIYVTCGPGSSSITVAPSAALLVIGKSIPGRSINVFTLSYSEGTCKKCFQAVSTVNGEEYFI